MRRDFPSRASFTGRVGEWRLGLGTCEHAVGDADDSLRLEGALQMPGEVRGLERLRGQLGGESAAHRRHRTIRQRNHPVVDRRAIPRQTCPAGNAWPLGRVKPAGDAGQRIFGEVMVIRIVGGQDNRGTLELAAEQRQLHGESGRCQFPVLNVHDDVSCLAQSSQRTRNGRAGEEAVS